MSWTGVAKLMSNIGAVAAALMLIFAIYNALYILLTGFDLGGFTAVKVLPGVLAPLAYLGIFRWCAKNAGVARAPQISTFAAILVLAMVLPGAMTGWFANAVSGSHANILFLNLTAVFMSIAMLYLLVFPSPVRLAKQTFKEFF